MTRTTTGVLCVLLATSIGGCHAMRGKWPDFDDSRLQLVLVAGEFSGVRQLNERPCRLTDEELDSGVVDCWGGVPSVTTLDVREVVYGEVHGAHLRVAYHPSGPNQDKPPGLGNPTLALLNYDGRHFVLTNERRRIARTTSGEWAMPVYRDDELTILPCGARPLIQPLRFANPQPSESLEEGYTAQDIEELAKNPRVRMDRGRFFITHGILLKDMRTLLASRVPAPDDYYCRDYEFPEDGS
jgi:hypothetical protein